VGVHVVEVRDKKGQSFRISIDIGYPLKAVGVWRTADKGFIRPSSAKCMKDPSDKHLTGEHLLLLGDDSVWGIRFDEWGDLLGVNKSGRGFVHPEWVLGLEPGFIDWVLVG
jgi:hypothetical protein